MVLPFAPYCFGYDDDDDDDGDYDDENEDERNLKRAAIIILPFKDANPALLAALLRTLPLIIERAWRHLREIEESRTREKFLRLLTTNVPEGRGLLGENRACTSSKAIGHRY